ncbi:MAG: nickel pincer cofactor biosynthesis protein LarC [Planctomycetota bacterium]|nr:nickel pincer cofactor biosynthesis protein LarC [Planctomycetota bacterium]
MKIAYLDCASGISGDMTLGALVDAGIDLETIQAGIDSLGLEGCRLSAREVTKNGFRATQVQVDHPPEHKHRHLCDIHAMIDASDITPGQKELAKNIFRRLGEAEAKVHGTTLEKVHFHEVGAVDSIADIVGAAIGWNLLQVDRICASPVPTGTGSIEIAHGRCSLPAPATTELLKGIPLAESHVDAELTTPTGAAILAELVDSFGQLPAMAIETIGCGAGQRDLPGQPNLLRLILGTAADAATTSEMIWVVETQLDDATGEWIGHLKETLLASGAVDAFCTSIQMKKNRPGILLTVLCHAVNLQQIETTILQNSTTLGLRKWSAERTVLPRRVHRVSTPWGEVAGVVAQRPPEQMSFAPEYEDCQRLAEQANVPLIEIYRAAQQAFEPGGVPPFSSETTDP